MSGIKTLLLAVSLALASAAVWPTGAFAQDSAETEIVVTGEREIQPDTVRDVVRLMSTEHRSDEPLVRFHDPICLRVRGFDQSSNTRVSERILANARAAGVDVAEDDCRSNALILVVDDPLNLVRRLQDKQPGLISPAVRRRLEAELARGESVLVWHNDEARGQYGEPLRVSTTAPGMPVTGPSSQFGASVPINSHGRARRVDATGSRAVTVGVVVLDIEHLVGMDLERVADFATMRLLAPGMRGETPQRKAGEDGPETDGPQSVIAPFAAGRGSERLTSFDRSWLSALYDLSPDAASRRLPQAVTQIYLSGEK